MLPTMITRSAKPAVNVLLLPPTCLLCPVVCPIDEVICVYSPLKLSFSFMLSIQDGYVAYGLDSTAIFSIAISPFVKTVDNFDPHFSFCITFPPL